MQLRVRPVTPSDVTVCGRIIYAAFKSIAERHNFPPDFPSATVATQVAGFLIRHPAFYGVVAEHEATIVGCNFLSERDPVRAVGPVSVDPAVQEQGVGRVLMEAVLARAQGAVSVRLVQDAFNTVSMSLYTSLGFAVREPLVVLGGKLRAAGARRCEVRALRESDVQACSALCRRVHGIERTNELRDMLDGFAPVVAVRDGRIVAYATTLSLWQVAHGVAESLEDMQDLIAGAAAASPEPISFPLPTRQTALFQWCLRQDLRIIKPMTLMSIGTYQEPEGCFFPSVAY